MERLEARVQLNGAAAAIPRPVPRLRATDRAPDLVAWASRGRGYIYDWTLDPMEIPGRLLLRLTTAVANIGQGPLEIRGGKALGNGRQQVWQRIYNSDGGYRDRKAGAVAYHPSHGHTHMDDFAVYRLRTVGSENSAGRVVGKGSKTSFCLLDIDTWPKRIAGAAKTPAYEDCGVRRQGISVGWADIYDKWLPDQWIDVTEIPVGRYWLEVVVDPFNRILETNERNNTQRIRINLRKPPIKAFPERLVNEAAPPVPASPGFDSASIFNTDSDKRILFTCTRAARTP